MSQEFGIRLAKGAVWAALAFAVACHLWAANRGLEMTDEASYLLIALDPWHTWGHGTFHGFLLRPLYLLGGSSVVGMRWIGYAVLLMTAWRLASAIRLRLGAGNGVVSSLAAPVLLTASMTVYCGGIRTPCYNWMILVGAMLAWSGWLWCGNGRFGPIELGLGLTVAVVGKWGAALMLLFLFAALSLLNRKDHLGPTPRDWTTALLTFAGATLCFAIYAGWAGIVDTLQAGVLIAQTTGSHGWFILPKYAGEMVYYLYRVARAYVWLLPAILLFWWLGRRNPSKWPVTKIATILFAGGLSLGALRGWWRGGIEQFGKESVLAGCWLLGMAWTIWAIERRSKSGGQRAEGGNRLSVVTGHSFVLWGLALTAFLCGIGTNTSIADYAGQGTVFFVGAGVLMMGALPADSLKFIPIIALSGLCIIQASRVSTALLGMYRLGSVFDQTKLLVIGPEAGRLRVNQDTCTQVESIHQVLKRENSSSAVPVVGVDSLCGWIYLAGGTSPGVPWYFRDQPEYLRQVLIQLNQQALRSSWLWIRSSSLIADPVGWWPQATAPLNLHKAGEIPLQTDRGNETLSLFTPRR